MRIFFIKQKLTSCCVFRNKTRMFLSVLGICIGLFFFLVGNAAINAYLGHLYENAYAFNDTGYLLVGKSNDVSWMKEAVLDKVTGTEIYYTQSAGMRVNQPFKYKNLTIDTFATFVGCEAGFTEHSVYSQGDDSFFLGKSKIIYGRDLSVDDIVNESAVCVLEKSTSILLFQKEDSVGEILHVQAINGYFDVEVVGIMEDLYPKKQDNFEFNKKLAQGEEEAINYDFYAYAPKNSLELVNYSNNYSMCVLDVDKNAKEEAELQLWLAREEANRQHREVSVMSETVLLEDVKSIESNIKGVLSLLMVFVVIFSGFVVLTIFLFSVKERVSEIGIRRALGASRTDIIIQFVLEGLLLSLISAAIAVFCSLVFGNYVSYFLKNVLFVNTAIKISPKLIFATFGISVFQGIAFSVIPAFAAARVRPTEAIRWD